MAKNTESFDNILSEDMQDPKYVVGYLNLALEDPDPRHFLLALRRVAKARKVPMTKISEQLKVNRRGLYHALSEKGNPEWSTLHGILDILGFNIQIAPKKRA